MSRKLLSILLLTCIKAVKAEEDYYSEYIKDLQKSHAEAGTPGNYSDTYTPNSNDYDYKTGYSGSPIYDKHKRMVVFEGPGVSRKTAEDYVKQYNETH